MEESDHPRYETQKGDHWIESLLQRMTEYGKRHEPSPEFNALLGVARGIKSGTVTRGDRAYADIAMKATLDGSQIIPFHLINELGGYGLFNQGPLGGSEAEFAIAMGAVDKPILSDWLLNCEEGTFKGKLFEEIHGLDLKHEVPEANILTAVMYGVRNGAVRHADPTYGKLLIELAYKIPEKFADTDLLQRFGEAGLYGSELLLGCEPERATAVGRLK